MNKRTYGALEMEIISFDTDDVITNSGGDDEFDDGLGGIWSDDQ